MLKSLVHIGSQGLIVELQQNRGCTSLEILGAQFIALYHNITLFVGARGLQDPRHGLPHKYHY